MKFYILILCFNIIFGKIIGQEYEGQNMTYMDDVLILAKLFSQVDKIQENVEALKLRCEDQQKTIETAAKDLPIFDERFDAIPNKCKTEIPPKNCAEATACIQRSGIYYITLPAFSSDRYLVECDIKTEGGIWTLIQRRQDGSVDFLRKWSDYQNGFGSIDGEFFIGLNLLHAFTHFDGPQELLIRLQDKNETRVAKYSNFAVGNESESYNLKHLGVYSGNAGDSLMYHLGAKFSTIDHDNDEDPANCAETYTGAWWHKICHVSNLNGKYGDNRFGKGLTWKSFRGYNVSIQHVTMMIRRRTF